MKKLLPFTLSILGLVILSLFYYLPSEPEQEIVLYDEIEVEALNPEDTLEEEEIPEIVDEGDDDGDYFSPPSSPTLDSEEITIVATEEDLLPFDTPITTYATSTYPWCDTQDITVGSYTIAACNVGASVAGTGAASYGSLFQWGNNYRFPSAWSVTTSPTLVNASTYWPTNPYYGSTFITTSSTYDRTTPKNDNLRGNTTNTDEARQWPCAAGYHLPTNQEWQGVIDTAYAEGVFNWTKAGTNYNWNTTEMNNLMAYLNLPLAGSRLRESGGLINQRSRGLYWASTPNWGDAYCLIFYDMMIYSPTTNYRSHGFSARCFKNSVSDPSLSSVSYDPLSWTGGVVTVTVTLDQTGAMLTGWTVNGNIFTKVYSINTTETVTFPSTLWGTVTTGISVTNIDTTPPTISAINQSPTTPTSWSVTLTVTASDAGVGLDAMAYSFDTGSTRQSGSSERFSGNGMVYIQVRDAVGNIATTGVNITNIDMTPSVPTPIPTPSTSGGGGRGGSLKKDNCPNGDYSPSYYDGTCGEKWEEDEHHASEEGPEEDSPKTIYETAYERAKEYGITTASTYEEARTTDAILRQEMAKMISVYAIKLFQKTPDTSKVDCSQFHDLSQAGGDLQPYIIQSCELGLMGMNGDGIGVQENFFPSKTITRAEVGTVLSRLLRGTQYATQLGDETYYGRHLQALKKAGIMNFISNPDMLELRGNILLMLRKSVVR